MKASGPASRCSPVLQCHIQSSSDPRPRDGMAPLSSSPDHSKQSRLVENANRDYAHLLLASLSPPVSEAKKEVRRQFSLMIHADQGFPRPSLAPKDFLNSPQQHGAKKDPIIHALRRESERVPYCTVHFKSQKSRCVCVQNELRSETKSMPIFPKMVVENTRKQG